MTEIISGLFLGSKSNSLNDEDFLTKNNIKCILNCAREIEGQNNMVSEYLHLQLDDEKSQDLTHCFENAADYIQESLNRNQNILVHCMHGASRSASIVIAYLILKKNMTCWKAKDFVQNKRPEVSPNDGFWEQLQQLFNQINPNYLKK